MLFNNVKITTEKEKAANTVEEINNLLLNVTANDQKIKDYVENFENEYKKLEKLLDEKYVDLKDLSKSYSESIKAIEGFISGIDFEHTGIKEKSKDFDDQLAKLNELLGKETARTLFSTFKERKAELSKPVRNWMRGVILASLFALIWVSAVFTNFFGWVNGEIVVSSEFLLLNTLKSIPAIILLYFTIRQYVRERNVQEEYAFRSAIALTIQAYGDMVGDKKHDLILAATSTIYTMPTTMKEKTFSLFRKKDNGLIEVMKQLNETLKTVQQTTKP